MFFSLPTIANRVFDPNRHPRMAVNLMIGTPRGLFLAVRRAEGDFTKHWSILGGMVEAGETPIQAAIREAGEEARFKITTQIRPLSKQQAKEGRHAGTHIVTLLAVIERVQEITLNGEHDAYKWVALGRWPEPVVPATRSMLKENKNKIYSLIGDPDMLKPANLPGPEIGLERS